MKKVVALALVQPSFIAALAGPFIISVYLIMLRGEMNFPYGASVSGESMHLKATLEAPYTYALVDLGVQLCVLFVAWLLLLSDVISSLYICNARKPRILAIYFRDFKDGWFWVALLLTIMFVMFVLFGGAASPGVVEKYLPGRSWKIFGRVRFPPYASVVTWGRILIIVVGLWWVFVREKRLPQ